MDTLTHAIFGAVVGQAGFRRSLGRRAMAYGAAAAVLPDLDVVAGLVAGPYAAWLWHRGPTHSVFFAAIGGALLGWLVWRLHAGGEGAKAARGPLLAWVGLFWVVLFTHPVLDLFTHYGTQLLAPLSRHRFAIPAMPVIDPVYTLALLAAMVVGLFARRSVVVARGAGAAGLFFVIAYTLFAWSLNERAADVARRQLRSEGVAGAAVEAYPVLFQPYYRRIVVEMPDTFLIGFHSALVDRPIAWNRVERDHGALATRVAGTWEGEMLSWFAAGKVLWRTRSASPGALVEGYDVRYGLPGETLLGFWGIRAEFDAEQRPLGPPAIFGTDRAPTRERLGALFAEIFGQ